jgi:hypothetical protein
MPFTLLPLASAKAAWMVFSVLCLITGSLLMIASGGKKIDIYVLAGLAAFSALNFFSVVALSTGNLLPQLFLVIMLVLTLLKDRHDAMAGFLSSGILLLPQYLGDQGKTSAISNKFLGRVCFHAGNFNDSRACMAERLAVIHHSGYLYKWQLYIFALPNDQN